MHHRLTIASLAWLPLVAAAHGQNFVNFESPHVNPMDLTPDGSRLLVVNTADNRLEVFAVEAGGGLFHIGAVPVGIEPVSVRARTNDEAWVANHVSDTLSVVDLSAMNVRATLGTGDEPADVVFAGAPQRAFVSVSQLNQVKVYDPANLAAAPIVLSIQGEDPRALATDGTSVYAAIFESGNLTTIVPQTVVSSPVNPYPGDANPPPNSGALFDPPIAPGLPSPPDVSIIVKRQPDGTWRDDNNGNWSAAVGWNLHDHDVAVIDASSLAVTYVNGTMNANMNLAVSPKGQVLVVGTDAINHIRFEPNVQGIFVRVMGASFTGVAGPPDSLVDLNPHLDYSTPTVPQTQRDLALGDPRGVAFDSSGEVAYVSGMGSNNLVAIDSSLGRVDLTEVGQGPTAIRVNEGDGVLYVLNRFDATISIVDIDAFAEIEAVAFFDPTPQVIKVGRPHLYDTHKTSGLGQAACASCHIDARMDQIAWDLGNPAGEMKDFNQECNGGIPGGGFCEDWHPMKGPMATQTLVGIDGTEPLHWRGDREDLAAFNGAFEGLMGDDEQLTPQEMAEFTAFVATLRPSPNPNRNINHSLKTALPNGGNALVGSTAFSTIGLDGGLITCAQCHSLPTGTNGGIISGNLLQETQSVKVPQLRNMHEKTGFSDTSQNNNRGFGFIHDGSTPTLFEFLQFTGFTFPGGNQQRLDVEAFLLSFTSETHAGTGVQATMPGQTGLRDQLVTIAATVNVDLVAKGFVNGEWRGYRLVAGSNWQSDRAAEVVTTAQLDAAAGAGTEITYTLVLAGTAVRIGIDRDLDGAFDRDEIDACSNPADAGSLPQPGGCADVNQDGVVNVGDLVDVIVNWGSCPYAPPAPCTGDTNGDGVIDVQDLVEVIVSWS